MLMEIPKNMKNDVTKWRHRYGKVASVSYNIAPSSKSSKTGYIITKFAGHDIHNSHKQCKTKRINEI